MYYNILEHLGYALSIVFRLETWHAYYAVAMHFTRQSM
jgi:hypothetical protein